jgi:DNA processing protein
MPTTVQDHHIDAWKPWVALQQARRVGPTHALALAEAFNGDLDRAWHAPPAQIEALVGRRVAESIAQTRASLDLDILATSIRDKGHQVIPFTDRRYPELLKETSAPPLVLYVLGELTPEDGRAISVIGSRDSTPYGREVARQLAGDFAAAGVTVISGLARGIDGVAHEAALQAQGRTVAVLGGSLDWIYPSEHRGLAARICERGALVSEYPTRTRPVPGNFRARNRIMAGMSVGVVIVEARLRSGTLITANYAAHYNRDVFAVPGSILSEASEGCHQLIKDGAGLVRSAADVLRDLQLGNATPATNSDLDDLAISEIERVVFAALTAEPLHIDDLAADLEMPITDVATALMMLELLGRVRNTGAQHYARIR